MFLVLSCHFRLVKFQDALISNISRKGRCPKSLEETQKGLVKMQQTDNRRSFNVKKLCLWEKILFYGKFPIFLKRLQEASHKTYLFSNALFNLQAEVLSLGKGN